MGVGSGGGVKDKFFFVFIKEPLNLTCVLNFIKISPLEQFLKILPFGGGGDGGWGCLREGVGDKNVLVSVKGPLNLTYVRNFIKIGPLELFFKI